MTIKITDFIKNAIDIYDQEININVCCICKRPSNIIKITYGFDKYFKKVWNVKQYCEHCYQTNGKKTII